VSRYDWPADIPPEGKVDDPAARSAFIGRRRIALDPEIALRTSRTPQQPVRRAGAPHAPFAPASGREHLWQPLGPGVIVGGQAAGNPRVSGRINAICVHDDGDRIYAASANGGVWYSKNGGATWISVAGLATTNAAGILRPAQRNACGALHVVFGTTEGDDLVFLGTGEVTHPMGGEPGNSEGGIGILVGDKPTKSADPDPWVREAPNLVNNGVFAVAREPGGTTTIAATRTGLFQRPAAPGKDVNWERPTAQPFNTLADECSDILWTPANGGSPARLWVWVKSGANAGLWVRDMNAGGPANFSPVAVDAASSYGYNAGRGCLATSTPPTQVWVHNDQGSGNAPGLFRVTNPASGVGPAIAMGVVGVPNILRDSGFYNIAIAVDPANPNRVALAGSFLGDPRDPADILLVTTLDGAKRSYDASIVVADVAPDPGNANQLTYGLAATPFTLVGVGVHPDVHALAYSNGGARLWTGCDGGVFRSDRPTRSAGFFPCNNGLSISESNYIAVHPRCEGNIVAGLQDNGVVARTSSGAWQMRFKGDGGGVVMNAADPTQFMAQYVQGTWKFDPSVGTGPLVRGGTMVGEDGASAFYSSAASIAHVRSSPPAANANFSQTIVGTTRLWYTDDFGSSWTTLPTGTDPLPGNLAQDSIGQQITVCRWQSADVAWVLCEQQIRRYARTPGSHNAGGPGSWTSAVVAPPGYTPTGKAKKRPPRPPSLLDSTVWTDIAVNLDPPPAVGQPPAHHGTLGALYIGTIGHETMAGVDTLWWFDGTDKWYATGMRTKGAPAPVTALVCNPAAPNEVWVGTTVGVWHGVRTDHAGADPTWDFTQRVNGLPEAAVEDLALFVDGSLVLLRAAIASRGVWELRLDRTDVADLTYMRVHDDDLRHRIFGDPAHLQRAVGVKRDLRKARSWHGSPDVRPRLAPTAVAAPSTLPWRRNPFTGTAELLRRFQTAMRASTGDPRIVANGVWDSYFSEVLRDHGAPTVAIPPAPPLPALAAVRITAAFWGQHMKAPHATAEPWGAGPPTEADLYELTPPLTEGELAETSAALPPRRAKVEIIMNQRGLDAVDGANVRVTLLRWMDPKTKNAAKPKDPTTWFTANVPWTAAVNEVLNSADGKTALAMSSGWSFVLGTSSQSHRITLAGQTLDPTHAGVASFDLDLSGLKANRVVLLVAVIRVGITAADDIALAPATLEDLAMTRPNVAVRSLQITS
jgi:hypothetical protein